MSNFDRVYALNAKHHETLRDYRLRRDLDIHRDVAAAKRAVVAILRNLAPRDISATEYQVERLRIAARIAQVVFVRRISGDIELPLTGTEDELLDSLEWTLLRERARDRPPDDSLAIRTADDFVERYMGRLTADAGKASR